MSRPRERVCGAVHPENVDVTCMHDEPGHVYDHYGLVDGDPARGIAWPTHDAPLAPANLEATATKVRESLPKPDENAVTVRAEPHDTEAEAALEAFPESGTKRKAVLDHIASCWPDGATDEELQEVLGMPPNTQRPRRVELFNGGWVVDSGQRREFLSTGNEAIVWSLSERGKTQYGLAPHRMRAF